jgi:hypothetical protein
VTLFAPYQQAVTLAVDLPDRPDADAAFAFKSPAGGALESGTYARDAVATTLAVAAAAGAQAVTVASATGITVGRTYLVTAAEETGGERVLVKSLSGATVTLARPLRLAHLINAAFVSTRVTAALTAAATAAIGRHHRLELTWVVDGATQAPAVYPVDVTRYTPTTYLSFADVQALDGLAGKRLAAGVWWPELKAKTWEMLLRRVATKADPGAVAGVVDLTTAHLYLARAVLAESAGDEWEEHRKLMAQRFADELDAALTTTAVDNDQDGSVERHEGAFKGVELLRG